MNTRCKETEKLIQSTEKIIKKSEKLLQNTKKLYPSLKNPVPICSFCGAQKIMGMCCACKTTTVCAWCNNVVGADGWVSNIPIVKNVPLTHTICKSCTKKIKEEN